jgi:hypothetical protein
MILIKLGLSGKKDPLSEYEKEDLFFPKAYDL